MTLGTSVVYLPSMKKHGGVQKVITVRATIPLLRQKTKVHNQLMRDGGYVDTMRMHTYQQTRQECVLLYISKITQL